MTDMQDLAHAVNDLEDQLSKCTRCGMCQAVCPVFGQTRREADVSRGKLALLTGLADGLFDDPEGVSQRLNKCLLCGACQSNCPSNVEILSIFINARAIITGYTGLGFFKQILFKRLLSHPRFFNRLMDLAGRFQPLFIKPDNNFQQTSCARFLSPVSKTRHVVPIAPEPFHNRPKKLPSFSKQKGPRVVLFTGCLIDSFFPQIAHAVMDVCEAVSLGCVAPEGQGCCGIPALAAGDKKTFETLVSHHVRLFSGYEFDYLITACATCTSTIRTLWPVMVNQEDPVFLNQVTTLAEKTVDINWLLVHKTDLVKREVRHHPETCVTYHDPCHLKKSLGIWKEPRQVIQAAGYDIKEMAAPDVCCGMGGSFNLSWYDISKAIGQKKGADIIRQGCGIAATSCPACMLQISDVLAFMKSDICVHHPIELLARSLASNTLDQI